MSLLKDLSDIGTVVGGNTGEFKVSKILGDADFFSENGVCGNYYIHRLQLYIQDENIVLRLTPWKPALVHTYNNRLRKCSGIDIMPVLQDSHLVIYF